MRSCLHALTTGESTLKTQYVQPQRGGEVFITLQDLPSSLVGKLTYLSASIEVTMAPMYAEPAVAYSCCGICGG